MYDSCSSETRPPPQAHPFRPYTSHTIPIPIPCSVTHIHRTANPSARYHITNTRPHLKSKQPPTNRVPPNKKTNGKSKHPTFVFAPSNQTIKQKRERETRGTQKYKPYASVKMNYTHGASRHLEALVKAFEER
ncbi:hypothetical protein C7212DRAFT_322937 [Tuber magnatum]|uniref:Uncharacterized protein n=1 Tax=Tuber magnatum TaxID=42249 RepID=A0A317SL04_9PEZI|nr:hypothetical protein C7212DRAFT_322937 [Tuber magnatum]